MKKALYIIIKAMQSSFLPKEQEEFLDEMCIVNIKDLEYLSNAEDKRNIKGDIKRLNKDFNKVKKQAEIEFNVNL